MSMLVVSPGMRLSVMSSELVVPVLASGVKCGTVVEELEVSAEPRAALAVVERGVAARGSWASRSDALVETLSADAERSRKRD